MPSQNRWAWFVTDPIIQHEAVKAPVHPGFLTYYRQTAMYFQKTHLLLRLTLFLNIDFRCSMLKSLLSPLRLGARSAVLGTLKLVPNHQRRVFDL